MISAVLSNHSPSFHFAVLPTLILRSILRDQQRATVFIDSHMSSHSPDELCLCQLAGKLELTLCFSQSGEKLRETFLIAKSLISQIVIREAFFSFTFTNIYL